MTLDATAPASHGQGGRALGAAVAALLAVAAGLTGCADGGDEAPAPHCEDLLNAPPPLTSLRVTIDGPRVLDALGREVLLRGVNTGGRAKLPPFFAFPFAESDRPEQRGAPPFADALGAYLDRVVAWGHNAIRLPFSWEAVEPTRGAYDDAFLDRYEAVVAAAGARGLRVIVDFHQDVFARPYCGDGFPLWAMADPDVPPKTACADWFLGYSADARVRGDFDRFWRNDDGLMDAFEAMWRHVAARLWPHDQVAGFEVINEPGHGTADPEVWAPDVLAPFYTRMAAVIREVAPAAPIFFDATGVDAVTTQTALPRPAGDGLVFAPHYYDPPALLAGLVDPNLDVHTPLGRWRALGDAWAVPVLLGEFGVRPDAPGAAGYVRKHFDALDAHGLHGTLWEYSATVDDWNGEDMSVVDGAGRERETVAELIRAFPAATAGRVVSFTFDRETRAGRLVYDAVAGGVTELRVPERLYAGALAATATAAGAAPDVVCVAHDRPSQTLRVAATAAGRVTVDFGPTVP